MTDTIHISSTTPWYKQFWPWFLISLPGSVVIASIATIIIAINNPDPIVADNYYEEGLAINQDLSRQQLAENLDIRASIQFNDDQLRMQIKTPDNRTDKKLLLRFIHPTLSDRDQQILLKMIAPGLYQASIKPLANGRWNVSLLSAASNWEIRQRIKIENMKQLYTLR